MSTDSGSDLRGSQRFTTPKERRDFLGLAAMWSAAGAFLFAMVGALRLPMPSVFPESNPRVKLGPPEQFLDVEVTPLPEHRLWVFSSPQGLYAISAVCPHLGCIVGRQEDGYFCPCHGSRFDVQGKVIGGPAPRGLVYLEMSISPDGKLVVDREKEVDANVRVKA